LNFLRGILLDDYQLISSIIGPKPEKETALLFCEFLSFFVRDAWQIKYLGTKNVWNKDMAPVLTQLFAEFNLRMLQESLKYISSTLASLKKSANAKLALDGLYLNISGLLEKCN
jgi:hypothetical protein